MNKKGFTLVEVIATVSLLAIAIILVSTKGFGAFNTAKKKIDEVNEETIVEGAEILKVEMENCDDEYDKELIESLLNRENVTCVDLYEKLNEGLTVDKNKLIDNKFIFSNSIKDDENYSITYTMDLTTKKISYELEKTKTILLVDAIKERAKEISEDEMKNNGYAMFREPITKPGEKISQADEAVLSTTEDDHGTTYYFRGNVKDNYVNFAGMCWRIVRISGDNSIKLILDDLFAECNDNETNITLTKYTGKWYQEDRSKSVSYNSTSLCNCNDISLNNYLKSFQNSKMSSYLSYLKNEEWCKDNNITEVKNGYGWDDNYDLVYNKEEAIEWYEEQYFGAYTRINEKKPSLKCETGTKLTKFKDNTVMYVGTLTADEVVFAGAYTNKNDTIYISSDARWWTLSPANRHTETDDEQAFLMEGSNVLSFYYTDDKYFYAYGSTYARPAVSLKQNIEITGGNGTKNEPYVIKQ